LAANPLPDRNWCPRVDPQVRFVKRSTTYNLSPDQPQPVVVAYEWDGRPKTRATVTLEFEDSVDGSKVVQIVPSEQAESGIDLAAKGELVLFRLNPLRNTAQPDGVRSAKLVLKVQIGQRTAWKHPIDVHVFGREYVNLVVRDAAGKELEVERTERSLQGPDGQATGTLTRWELQPFPNRLPKRAPHFKFALRNTSGQVASREVRLDVLRVLTPVLGSETGALLPSGEFAQGVITEPLAEYCRDVVLKGPEDFNPFDVEPPQEPAKDPADKAAVKPDAAKPDPAKAAEKPAAPPGLDVRWGLVFRVREKIAGNGRAAMWVHWVRLTPSHPNNYVEPTVDYNPTTQLLTVDAQPIAGKAPSDALRVVPDASAENYLKLARDPLTRPNGTVHLELKPTRAMSDEERLKGIDLFLNVDDYPRAFVYHLTPDSAGKLIRNNEFRRAKIVAPKHLKAFEITKDALPKDAGDVEIQVGVQIDAVPGDTIAVKLGDVQTRPLGSARAEHAWFSVGKAGVVTVDARVGDHVSPDHVAFKTAVPDEPIEIRAEVRSPDLYSDPKPVTVIIDTADPEVTPLSPTPATVLEGKGVKVTLSADARDAGGVAKVEMLVLDADKDEPEADDVKKPIAARRAKAGDKLEFNETKTWVADIDVDKEKLTAGTTPQGARYRLWVRASDQLGHTSSVGIDAAGMKKEWKRSNSTFTVKKEEPMVAKTDNKKGATIRGRVMAPGGGGPLAETVDVTLTPVAGTKAKADTRATKDPNPMAFVPSEFEYTFENVPDGKYELTVHGTIKAGGGKEIKEYDVVKVSVTPDKSDYRVDIKTTGK
jgi:hypothetical protein